MSAKLLTLLMLFNSGCAALTHKPKRPEPPAHPYGWVTAWPSETGTIHWHVEMICERQSKTPVEYAVERGIEQPELGLLAVSQVEITTRDPAWTGRESASKRP